MHSRALRHQFKSAPAGILLSRCRAAYYPKQGIETGGNVLSVQIRYSHVRNTDPPMITQFLKRPSPNKRSLEVSDDSVGETKAPDISPTQQRKLQKTADEDTSNGEEPLIPEELGEVDSKWIEALKPQLKKHYWKELQNFVEKERNAKTVYPPKPLVFTALRMTPLDSVKVVILGQDPYHGPNQAHGLAFSVPKGVRAPPSLLNILKEIAANCGTETPSHGMLGKWAEQGVLLLNTVLTVEAHKANSHKSKGWEKFTDEVIRAVNRKEDPVVFMLWGKPAQQKEPMLDKSKHLILRSPHPSPLSGKLEASKAFCMFPFIPQVLFLLPW
eukprot:gb/GECG01004944.1/.p1 GENE.gb/GECG01004944.1/~~gb/GECG01004944.1/.p1  ORF type:complete len:328 (+),score=34.18 gb/GECG01004944.1/:1-984(+)